MRTRRTRRILLLVTGLVALLALAACAPAPGGPDSPAAQDMVQRHNYVRGMNGIGPMSLDTVAAANAQHHADRLAAGRGDCSGLWHSGEMAGWYGGYAWAENVACVPGCPDNAQAAFDMWLGSPGHAHNAMNPNHAFIGVGVSCNGSVQTVVAHYRSS